MIHYSPKIYVVFRNPRGRFHVKTFENVNRLNAFISHLFISSVGYEIHFIGRYDLKSGFIGFNRKKVFDNGSCE